MGNNGMCKIIQQKLMDFVEGELPAADAGTVRQHLEGCHACQARLEGLEATLEAARTAKVPQPSSTFWANYLPEVRQKIKRAPSPWPARIIPAVGVAMALIFVVFQLTRQPELPPITQLSGEPGLEEVV